jgi:hypothetical protein
LANAYYLVNADEVDQARACAPESGGSHELFGIRWNNDQTKAVVQAEWGGNTPPGVFLGNFNGGDVDQAVYDELAKPEWNSIEIIEE